MTPSPNPITSPRTRQRFCDDAYNEREHAILECLRGINPDLDVTSFEQLAELAGLSVPETEKTVKILVKRRLIYVVPVYEGQPLPLRFKATRSSTRED